MQENTNAELLFGVLKDSIDFIEDDFARGRMSKRLNNLMSSDSLNLDDETAINYSIDIKSNADRYNFDLISDDEFIANMKGFIESLELTRTTTSSEIKGHKRH